MYVRYALRGGIAADSDFNIHLLHCSEEMLSVETGESLQHCAAELQPSPSAPAQRLAALLPSLAAASGNAPENLRSLSV